MAIDGGRGDREALRVFKASFFKALAHPLRIHILELLRDGPLSVGQLQDATSSPGSSVSQQLAVLRGQNVVATERLGTTILYRIADPELVELLDVARRIFNAHLSDKAGLLRLVEAETSDDSEAPVVRRTRVTGGAAGNPVAADGQSAWAQRRAPRQ